MRSIAMLVSLALVGCGAGTRSEASGSAAAHTHVQVSSADGAIQQQIELTREDNTVTAVLPAHPDTIWNQILHVYQEIGLAPDDLAIYDPQGHRIAVADRRIGRLAGKRLSLLLNCGHSFGIPREDTGDVRIFLSTWLSAREGQTLVMTRFEGRQGQAGSACESRGRLEQEIVARILQRL